MEISLDELKVKSIKEKERKKEKKNAGQVYCTCDFFLYARALAPLSSILDEM